MTFTRTPAYGNQRIALNRALVFCATETEFPTEMSEYGPNHQGPRATGTLIESHSGYGVTIQEPFAVVEAWLNGEAE